MYYCLHSSIPCVCACVRACVSVCVYDTDRQKDTDGRTHDDAHARPPSLVTASVSVAQTHARHACPPDLPSHLCLLRRGHKDRGSDKSEHKSEAEQGREDTSEAERTPKLRVLLLLLPHSFHLLLLLRLWETAPRLPIYIYRQYIYIYRERERERERPSRLVALTSYLRLVGVLLPETYELDLHLPQTWQTSCAYLRPAAGRRPLAIAACCSKTSNKTLYCNSTRNTSLYNINARNTTL